MPINLDLTNEKRDKILTPEEEIRELERLLASKKEGLNKEKAVERPVESKPEMKPESKPEIKPEVGVEKEKTAESAREKLKSYLEKENNGLFIKRRASQAVVQMADDTDKLKDLEAQQQVKKLTELAFNKGIYYAIDVAKNLNDPYLLVMFHSTLIDELQEKIDKDKNFKKI